MAAMASTATLVVIAGPPLPGRSELARALAERRGARQLRVRDANVPAREVREALADGVDVVLEGDFLTRADRREALYLADGNPVLLVMWICTRDEALRVVRGRFAGRLDFVEKRELEAFDADQARREFVRDEVRGEQLAVVPGASPVSEQLRAVEDVLPTPVETQSSPPERRRVLAVDDDADLRDALAMVLEELGYEVETAPSGEEALARLGREGAPRVDLVVADQRMPGMTGTELIARLQEEHPAVRTLLLTGFGDDNIAADALRSRAATVLAKPLRVMDLRRALDEALA